MIQPLLETTNFRRSCSFPFNEKCNHDEQITRKDLAEYTCITEMSTVNFSYEHKLGSSYISLNLILHARFQGKSANLLLDMELLRARDIRLDELGRTRSVATHFLWRSHILSAADLFQRTCLCRNRVITHIHFMRRLHKDLRCSPSLSRLMRRTSLTLSQASNMIYAAKPSRFVSSFLSGQI